MVSSLNTALRRGLTPKHHACFAFPWPSSVRVVCLSLCEMSAREANSTTWPGSYAASPANAREDTPTHTTRKQEQQQAATRRNSTLAHTTCNTTPISNPHTQHQSRNSNLQIPLVRGALDTRPSSSAVSFLNFHCAARFERSLETQFERSLETQRHTCVNSTSETLNPDHNRHT